MPPAHTHNENPKALAVAVLLCVLLGIGFVVVRAKAVEAAAKPKAATESSGNRRVLFAHDTATGKDRGLTLFHDQQVCEEATKAINEYTLDTRTVREHFQITDLEVADCREPK